MVEIDRCCSGPTCRGLKPSCSVVTPIITVYGSTSVKSSNMKLHALIGLLMVLLAFHVQGQDLLNLTAAVQTVTGEVRRSLCASTHMSNILIVVTARKTLLV